MTHRIIFLDIDGVLVNNESLRKRAGVGGMAQADPACVAYLNAILQWTGALIVVTSTWRAHGFNGLSAIFESWGITSPIWSFTPDLAQKRGGLYAGVERGDEIQKWINANPGIVGKFVILDDSMDMKHLLPRLVKTDSDIGLTRQDAHRAIAMLTHD